MNTPALTDHYKHHRFPVEIISHGDWLHSRFCLSYRDAEEFLFARGIIVTYEAIGKWCRKFGQPYANQLRHRRTQPGDKWHLDEVLLTIKGERYYLWRAVDQDGHVLHSRATASQQGSCQEILSQAAQGLEVCAAGNGYRQTGELWGCQA